MSTRPFLPAQDARHDAYVVAAPCQSDVLRRTLHSAYNDLDDSEPFADLLRKLDRIEFPTTPR